MRLTTLVLLCCPECRSPLSAADPYLRPPLSELTSGRLVDGAVLCPRCSAWYPCDAGLLDLRPAALQSADRRGRIASRHGLEQQSRGAAVADAHKSGQERFFTEEAEAYERDVVNSTFYQALDNLTVHRWGAALPPNSVVLDIGAGTGRVALRLAERGHHVIALDLTEALLRQAQQKAGAAGITIDALVADAESLPVQDGRLDAAVAHGVLHHMAAPAAVISHVGRALRDGGRWFSLDPHRSPFRAVFDAAMRLAPLWKEEAAPDALQTEARLLAWCGASGIAAEASYSCYVLPHLLTSLPRSWARAILRTTDALFDRSVLRSAAGVIHVSGIKRPIRAGLAPENPRTLAVRALALLAVVVAAGAWQVDTGVALNSTAYYMGGLGQTMAVANAPHQWGALMIDTSGGPLEQGLDDIGYALALQALSSVAGPLSAGGVAHVHQGLYAVSALILAWAVSWRVRSTLAGVAMLVLLLVLGQRLAMLLYGQVSNQTITSVFPLVFLAALAWWSAGLGPERRAWHPSMLLGVLAGLVDLTRHSHGLAVLLTVATVLAVGVHGLRSRARHAFAFAVGFALMTIAVPAALKLHRDVHLGRYDGWHLSYLAKPPQHHVYYTLLTSVGRYPNSIGLTYEDRVVDQYIATHATAARTTEDLLDASRTLLVQYVRAHPAEYMRTVIGGVVELPAFLAYTTFMAERRWTYAWPAIRPGIDVDPSDVARYGERLLMNVRYRYLRLSWWQWALFGLSWTALVIAAVLVLRRRPALEHTRLLIGGALVYVAWVALPRALVPVQGMDLVFAFWAVSLLCAAALWRAHPPAALQR